MSRSQTTIVVLAALLAGFLGGILSQHAGMSVFAQTSPTESVEAQEFRLVDASGRLLGLIKPTPTDINAGDDSVIVVPFGDRSTAGSGAIMLFDSRGRAIWSAPEPIDLPARVKPLAEPN